MAEEPNDFQTRAKAFLEEYGLLVKRFNVDLASYPVYQPSGKPGVFETSVQTTPVDISKKEDFVAKE